MPGTIIKHLREKKGMKQETVAREMGISQAAYSKIENNITELTVRHCKLLSKILEANVYDFFDDNFIVSNNKKVLKKQGTVLETANT
jgi:transcriptional regulator with XRE-family HTH domain